MQHNASKNNGRRRRESRPQPADDDPSRHSFAFIGVTNEGGRGDSELSSSTPQPFAAGTRRDIASLPSTTTTTTTGREAPSSGPFMTTETSTTSTTTSSLHPIRNPHQYFMVHGRGGGQRGLPSPLAFHHQHHPQPPPSAISVPFSTSSSSHTSLERHQQHQRQNLSSTATSIAHFPSSSAAPASSSSSSTQHQPYTEQQEHASTRPGGRSIGRTRRPASHSADLATAATGGTNRTIDESFSTTTTLTSSVPIGARIGERIPEAYGTMSTAASAVPIEDNIYTSIEQRRPLGALREQALSRSTEEEETRQGEEGQTTITTTTPITTTANNRIESMQTSHMPSSSSKDYYAHGHHILPSMPLPPTTSSYEGNPALQLPQPPNYPPPSTSISLLDRVQRQHEWSAVRDQREEMTTTTMTTTTSFASATPSSSAGPMRHTQRHQRTHHSQQMFPSVSSSSSTSASSTSPHFHPYLPHRRRSVPTPGSQTFPLPGVGEASTYPERPQPQPRTQQEQPQTQTPAQGPAGATYSEQGYPVQQPGLPSHAPLTAHHLHHHYRHPPFPHRDLGHPHGPHPSFAHHRSSYSYPYAPSSSSRLSYAYPPAMPPSATIPGPDPFHPPHMAAFYPSVSGTSTVNVEESVSANATSSDAGATNPQSHPHAYPFHSHPHLHTHTMPFYPPPTMPSTAHPPPSHHTQTQHPTQAQTQTQVHESFSYIPPATTTGSAYSPRPDTAATSSFGYLSGAGGVPTGDEDDGEDQEEEAEEQGERERGEQEGDVRSPPELPQPHDVEEPNTQDDEDNTRQQQQEEEEDNFVDETEEFDDATTTRSKDKKRKKQDPRPHKCDECGKAFPRPSALETHKTVHSGAKPYNCPVVTCNKSFAVRSNARRHLKTHGIKLKTRDRKSRSKAASLNKALALGGLSGRMSGGEGNRDTSPDNDMGSEGEGEDSFGASGESMPFPPDSYSAPSRAATTMTTTTVIRDAGRIPYPTGERMLSRVPGAGLRPAMHRGHVNTRVDEDEVLGLGGIEPLSSEIEILQRPEEEEDGETSEEEVEGEGGAKVKRQSLRIGAGRKVIIETAGAITSKKRQGEITSASGSGRGGKEKGKGKVVADSAEKLRGKRRGVAEARRQRGVESRRSEERRDEHVEGRVNPPFMGTDGGEHGEEGGEGPVLDQEELRNLWASTQRRHLASSSASVGGGGEGDPSSMLGADGRQHATIGSLPKLDQEALEKLIAAPTAWENYQRQLKMKQTLAASTSASGGGGGGGTGGENPRNEGAGGGGSGAGEATDPNTFGELVGADGPSNHLDQMIAMAHSQIPLHSGSSVVSSFGPLPHASSSVRTSVIAPPPMLASTIYFDQQRPAAVAVNGTTAFNPQSPEADIIDRRPWINPTSSSSSVSSLSPIEGGVGSGALNAISAAADTNDTTLDVTCPPINEEEDIPSGFNRFDGTWIPDSMRRFKNVDRLRNSAPFDDLGLSTLQMQFPLTAVQPTTTSTATTITVTTTTATTATVATSASSPLISPSSPLNGPHGWNIGEGNCQRPIKKEERNSFASDIGRNPYHDVCFGLRPILPGPAPPNSKFLRRNTMIRFRRSSITA